MDVGQLWADCRAGDGDARRSLIERYAEFAERVARGVNAPQRAITSREDLVSAGLLGLIDAVDRFDPSRGVPFEAYAATRVRGAVLDELRRVDDLSRDARRDAATSDTVATRIVSLDEIVEGGRAVGPSADDGHDERHEREDLQQRITGALNVLPPRQRELIARYYGDSLTLREAGRRMGISEARACQLHGRAIFNLRKSLAPVAA